MSLVVCPVCRYYFPNYKIRHHQKICLILYQATGNKNNSQIISRLTPGQQNQVINYYSQYKNNNTKSIAPYKQQTREYYNRRTPTPPKNKYQYKSLHQARIRSPTTQAMVPYRPEYNRPSARARSNTSSNTMSYQDRYFQNQVAMYNRSKLSRREKIKEEKRTIQMDPSVQNFLRMKNQYTSYNPPSPSYKIPTEIHNPQVAHRLALPVPNTSRVIVPYNPPRSLSLIPTSTNFNRLVTGKTIALVGPSKSILGRNQGKYIDSFDLVVRLNKSLPVPVKRRNDIGNKTEIIYNSLNTSDYPGENNINPGFFLRHGIQYICSPYPLKHPFKNDIMNFMINNRGLIPFRYIDLSLFQKMENIMRTRPYTGTCAIVDLLKFNIKKLFITGLDFYATAYYAEYRHMDKNETRKKRQNSIHNAKPQIDLLRNLVLNDSRIEPDKVLDMILFRPFRNILKNISSKFNSGNVMVCHSTGKSHIKSFIFNWMTQTLTVEKPKIYFLGDDISHNTWNSIMQNKSIHDLVICHLTNPFLFDTSVEGGINILIDNDKSDNILMTGKKIKRDIGAVINIYQQKGKKYVEKWIERGVDNSNIIRFNTAYNRDMNQNLRRVEINNCSINLYLILCWSIFLNKYRLIVSGFDFSARRSENLFFKFLTRDRLLKICNN